MSLIENSRFSDSPPCYRRGMAAFDRVHLRKLTDRERTAFEERHPRSAAAYARSGHLFGRVPMTWMNKNVTGYPVYAAGARGARLTDIDGHQYVDFCLGDTGAMAGHSPTPVVEAVTRRLGELGGATTMLPTEDAAVVGDQLSSRFGVPAWSFTLTATDANRWAIRLLRAVSGRSRILVNRTGRGDHRQGDRRRHPGRRVRAVGRAGGRTVGRALTDLLA
jgi:glutamate-1-semialdehyde 2,1-aminomutase